MLLLIEKTTAKGSHAFFHTQPLLFRILVFICARLEYLLVFSGSDWASYFVHIHKDGATAPSFYYLNFIQHNLSVNVDRVFYLQNFL